MELKRLLTLGCKGEDVKEAQQYLNNFFKFYPNINLTLDGVFEYKTLYAVLDFQRWHHIDDDGIIGPQTWSLLEKNITAADVKKFESIADIASKEGAKKLIWIPNSEATKYTKSFEPWFGKRRFEWCGAFVHWCVSQLHEGFPIKPKNGPYTFALVEQWQLWAKERNVHIPNSGDYIPKSGDICIFDWDRKSLSMPDNDWDDHIGIVLEPVRNDMIKTAEGNVNNRTGIFMRKNFLIESYISFPEDFDWKDI